MGQRKSQLTAARGGAEVLWRYSREPIKQALLIKLFSEEELTQKALMAYVAIMKFMGDVSTRSAPTDTELTDQIFRAPLKEVRAHQCI